MKLWLQAHVTKLQQSITYKLAKDKYNMLPIFNNKAKTYNFSYIWVKKIILKIQESIHKLDKIIVVS